MRSTELDEFVERVDERTDIYSVVSRYVQLDKKNGRYWGLCPFHNEKTPSFNVSADKGLFYCFGCGAGGNAFKFLSLIENISYFEAIKLQAQRLGIDLPNKKLSPEAERRRRTEKDFFKINELAQDFYHECLTKSAHGESGRKYLQERGITPEVIENFKLGFAPDMWENLVKMLTKKGFSYQQIEAVGLISRRQDSSGYYDRFRERIIIPITDIFGHVTGFGGRIITEEKEKPKYINTSETPVFNKRKLLFGLDKSNRAISSAGKAIVVEGYMDAISLFSAGIKNVVATLGTAFTPEHAKLITRYTKKIVFCYDSDEAGQKATIRALPIVHAAGAEVFIITIPDGKDPDEFIRKHGKEEFETLINNAETMVDYRINYVVANAELTTTFGKAQALNQILPIVVDFDSEVMRNEYRKKISSVLMLDEQSIAVEWHKFALKRKKENSRKSQIKTAAIQRPLLPKDTTSQPQFLLACEDILRISWQDIEAIEYVLKLLPEEIFSETHREIIEWYRTCAAEERRPNKISAAEELSEAAYAELSRIFVNGFDVPREVDRKVFADALTFLRVSELKKEYDKLIAQADKYASTDREAYNKMIEASLKLKRDMEKLKRKR